MHSDSLPQLWVLWPMTKRSVLKACSDLRNSVCKKQEIGSFLSAAFFACINKTTQAVLRATSEQAFRKKWDIVYKILFIQSSEHFRINLEQTTCSSRSSLTKRRIKFEKRWAIWSTGSSTCRSHDCNRRSHWNVKNKILKGGANSLVLKYFYIINLKFFADKNC